MKKQILFAVLSLCLVVFSGCGSNASQAQQSEQPASGNFSGDEQPTYNENAQPGDEGVVETEEGNLIVPSTSEKYGNSHGVIRVTTPDKDGNFDVMTYHFPDGTLASVTYEMHFADAEQAKRVYEDHQNANVTDLKIEGNVVTYTTAESDWIGLKKRDVIDNSAKTWETLGYTIENQ